MSHSVSPALTVYCCAPAGAAVAWAGPVDRRDVAPSPSSDSVWPATMKSGSLDAVQLIRRSTETPVVGGDRRQRVAGWISSWSRLRAPTRRTGRTAIAAATASATPNSCSRQLRSGRKDARSFAPAGRLPRAAAWTCAPRHLSSLGAAASQPRFERAPRASRASLNANFESARRASRVPTLTGGVRATAVVAIPLALRGGYTALAVELGLTFGGSGPTASARRAAGRRPSTTTTRSSRPSPGATRERSRQIYERHSRGVYSLAVRLLERRTRRRRSRPGNVPQAVAAARVVSAQPRATAALAARRGAPPRGRPAATAAAGAAPSRPARAARQRRRRWSTCSTISAWPRPTAIRRPARARSSSAWRSAAPSASCPASSGLPLELAYYQRHDPARDCRRCSACRWARSRRACGSACSSCARRPSCRGCGASGDGRAAPRMTCDEFLDLAAAVALDAAELRRRPSASRSTPRPARTARRSCWNSARSPPRSARPCRRSTRPPALRARVFEAVATDAAGSTPEPRRLWPRAARRPRFSPAWLVAAASLLVLARRAIGLGGHAAGPDR